MQRTASPKCKQLQRSVIRGVEIEIRRAKRDLQSELKYRQRETRNLRKQEIRYIARLESVYRDVADLIERGKRLTQLEQVRCALIQHDRDKQSDVYDLVKQLMGYGDEGSNHQGDVSQRHEIVSNDPVAEAAKIARIASMGGIDWTKEPRMSGRGQ